MRKSVFRFKKFDCSHGAGSMKIGVDAVLLGAWADVSGCELILDAGTGCGVIALMCAQRNNKAVVRAIDIDEASVYEADRNFRNSPWYSRLNASLEDFNSFSLRGFDLIVSNPPYFESGVVQPDSPRLRARHKCGLSPETLLEVGKNYLSARGRIAMIVPADQFELLRETGIENGFRIRRAVRVRGHELSQVKRVLMEFAHDNIVNENNAGIGTLNFEDLPQLTLETVPGVATEEHKELCRDFYLKF